MFIVILINNICTDIPHLLGRLEIFYFDKIVFPIGHLNVYASNILWPTKLTRIGSKLWENMNGRDRAQLPGNKKYIKWFEHYQMRLRCWEIARKKYITSFIVKKQYGVNLNAYKKCMLRLIYQTNEHYFLSLLWAGSKYF